MKIIAIALYEILKIIGLIIYYYCEAFVNLFKSKSKINVTNKLVVITGAGRGLGKEIAIEFARLNANLALLDINKEDLNKTKDYLEQEFGTKVITYVCNVGNEEEVKITFDKIKKDFRSSVEILINNAGIVSCLPFDELESKSIMKTFEVNVFSQFWTIKNVLTNMKKRNSGYIVSISSIAGYIGNSNLTDYCSTKFAVNGLMEALKEELRKEGYDGIKLTVVCPVSMSTGMFKNPTTRFSFLLPIVDASKVANNTVNAILTNTTSSFSVPSTALLLHKISFFIPTKVKNLFLDILDYNVKSHK